MLTIFYWVLLFLVALSLFVPVPDNSPWGPRLRMGNTVVTFVLFFILGLKVLGFTP